VIKKTKIFCGIILVSLIFITAVLSSGCSPKTLNEDEFVKIYAEMVIAQDTAIYAPGNFNPVQDSIFKKYGVTRGEYTATIDSYNKDPQKWEKFFDKAISYVETLRRERQPLQTIKPK
jgi:hypothetical protein